MIRKEIRCAVLSIFLISLGGLLLHLRLHPPIKLDPFEVSALNLLPAILGIISVFVLPFMFSYRKTYLWAVMLNLLIVSAGTVSMIYFSATHWKASMPITIPNLILQTTLADIVILFARVPLGHSILKYWKKQS